VSSNDEKLSEFPPFASTASSFGDFSGCLKSDISSPIKQNY